MREDGASLRSESSHRTQSTDGSNVDVRRRVRALAMRERR